MPFRRFLWSLIVLLFPVSTIFSQNITDDLSNFSGLKSVGEVPAVMMAKSVDKYVEHVEREISNEEKKSLRKAKDEFYLSSTFQVDALMKSGQVIFGDEISTFLNHVKDKILDANGLSSEKNRIQVFTVKSANVNAFATDQGIVFFTTGLFSRLKNEAQVAYILGHELSHYLEKHNVESHVKKSTMKKRGQGIDSNALLASLSKYSRENEFVADKRGYELFCKMNYVRQNSIDALTFLGEAHVSKFRHEFNTSVWENEQFIFPDSIFTISENEIVAKMDDDDKESSHPKLTSRINALQEFIMSESDVNESNVGLDHTAFNKLVELATFESLFQSIIDYNYIRAGYEAYCMRNKYPNNAFLDRALTHCIYGLAKFKIHDQLIEFNEDDEALEGEEQSLYNMVNELSEQQMSSLALKISLEMNKKYPEDESFLKISEDLALELSKEELNILDNYKAGAYNTDSSFQYNALKDFTEDNVLTSIFAKAKKTIEDTTEETKELSDDELASKSTIRGSVAHQYVKIDLRDVEVNDLIVFAPIVTQLKRDYSPNLINSDAREGDFINILKETSEAAGVRCDIYSYHALEQSDTDMMNNMALLGQYISEVMEFQDIDKVPYLVLADDFREKLGTENIMFMSMTENNNNVFTGFNFLKMVLIYPIPDTFLKSVFPQRKVSYQNYLLNLESQKLIYVDTARLYCRNNEGHLKSKYYSLFYNLKSK